MPGNLTTVQVSCHNLIRTVFI